MSMRSGPGSRDPNFRGIDPAALGQVVQQLRQAAEDIERWLSANPAPAGASTEGYTAARTVQRWITEQFGMLTRRRNLALAQREDPDVNAPNSPELGRETTPVQPEADRDDATATEVVDPDTGTPNAPARPNAPNAPADPNTPNAPSGPADTGQETTPEKPQQDPPGSGADLGAFASTDAAVKAGVTDAYATTTALGGGGAVAAGVWKNLAEHAKDPEYTAAYYERRGPEGTAKLIQAADGDAAKLKAITQSLAAADNQFHMNAQWVAKMLAEADRLGNRAEVVQLIQATPLSPRLDAAVTVADQARLTTAAKVS